VRAKDPANLFVERDLAITVFDSSAGVPILASANPICPGQSVTLSVPGTWSSYSWLPGGQTSPSISVSPTEPTDYAVLLTDASGCSTRGSVRISLRSRSVSLSSPRCAAALEGGLSASTEDAGAGAVYFWTATNGTLTSGQGTRRITFTAGSSGAVKLGLSLTTADGCAADAADVDVPIGCAARAAGLIVDSSANSGLSNGDGILEPGETVIVRPSWKNSGGGSLPLSGTASAWVGPAGATYSTGDSAADYGVIPAGGSADCGTSTGNCYAVTVSKPAARPVTHWDSALSEALSNGDPSKTWNLHVGESFTDVPKTHVFYPFVETLLHNGITTGCTATAYCPDDAVFRLQMAVFLARAQAGGDEDVPAEGFAQGSAYDCAPGGTSLFTDVDPASPFCRHVHYNFRTGVTTGCEPGKFCPNPKVSRGQMAMFIARAVAGGDASVPKTYGPDPQTGRTYSCDPTTPNVRFTDIKTSDIYCRHVHYLWAKDVISGFPDNSYGPSLDVTRGAMAKFLSNGFGLKLYGP
jgi:hypothetical protein